MDKISRRIFMSAFAGAGSMICAPGLVLGQTAAQSTFRINPSISIGKTNPMMYGVNMLADFDRVSGNFGLRAQDLRPTLVRWPGGAVAEDKFDPLDPDANIKGAPVGTMRTGLRDFLSWCGVNRIQPAIVLPTVRYADEASRGDFSRMEFEIGEFIRRVTRNVYGPTRVLIWEIGNEHYVGDQIASELYGRIAGRMAAVIRRNSAYPAQISMQGPLADNDMLSAATLIMRGLNSAGGGSRGISDINLISIHSYPLQDNIFTIRNTRALGAVFANRPYFFSEWNVKSREPFPPGAFYGMRQMGAMIHHFAEMSTLRTYAACLWPVQQQAIAALYPPDRTAGGPFIGQQAYLMLKAIGVSDRVMVTKSPRSTESEVEVNAFVRPGRAEIFVRGRGAQRSQVFLEGLGSAGTFFARRYTGPESQRMIASVRQASVTHRNGVFVLPINVEGPHEVTHLSVNI